MGGLRARRIATALLPLLLSACVSFLPDYRADLYARLTDVQAQLARVETVLAIADAPVPYARVEPYYIDALADLRQAAAIADSRASYHRGTLAEKPAANSARAVELCRRAIEEDRATWRRDGPAPNQADNVAVLRHTCSVPGRLDELYRR